MCTLNRRKNIRMIDSFEGILTKSSSLRLCLPIAPGTPADRLPSEIPCISLFYNVIKERRERISYHIKTQGNIFSPFRYIRCTVNTIIKSIVHLLFTGCITKSRDLFSINSRNNYSRQFWWWRRRVFIVNRLIIAVLFQTKLTNRLAFLSIGNDFSWIFSKWHLIIRKIEQILKQMFSM